jgi:uncharacterized protein with NAD-binding domain and iron-sulfur cluster
MAAAWDLTCPDNPNRCHVTIFQMGGRLGGKGASSRDGRKGYGNRIEEHGLHLWLGYYENAFRMVRTCFDELRARDKNGPFNNWDWLSAFERASRVGLADDSSGDWVPWIARFPEYVWKGEPGAIIYQLPDGAEYPGVHLVDDKGRAYPGEEPKPSSDCDDGEDVCLERPDVACFLTHALRELEAFLDSLEERIEQAYVQMAGVPPPEDPNELLSQALNLDPATHADSDEGPPADILRTLRIIRLSFLVPTIQAFSTVARIAEGPIPYQTGIPYDSSHLVSILDRLIDSMRDKVETFVQTDAAARRIWELIDLLAANIRGLLAAGLQGTDDFSSLDEWDYIEWLRANRIAERTLRNPILRGAYDLALAYRDGDIRTPQLAAGQAISAACRFFFMYKGALFWRLRAGMGDVVFAPLFLALRSRGVTFRFFHRLDEIELDPAGRAVTGLKFRQQVALVAKDPDAPTNYEPLVPVKGMRGWPRDPHIDQFDFDDATREEYLRLKEEDEQHVNFESIWCTWPHHKDVSVTVGMPQKGKDPDYDEVIVTVPIAALGRVSQQLVEAKKKRTKERVNPGARWEDMLRHLGTVATQSVQLWVLRTTRDLGWTHGQVSLSAFVHPFDTWADLSQLIKVETQRRARGVHYFCSVLPEWQLPAPLRLRAGDPNPVRGQVPTADIAAARDVVRENAEYFLDEWIFQLWPDAVRRYPNTFKWELLVAPTGLSGPERLNSQHLVANVDPSERYTQSLPGTAKYRIAPQDTGFMHLFIAGDWTECGLNFGCVEAAVISGRLASSGITGYPDTRKIPGYCRSDDSVLAVQGGY